QGKPVPDCLVIFYPLDDPADIERPQGYTDAEGRFELTARRDEPGAAEGAYSVVMLWRAKGDDGTPTQEFDRPNRLHAKYSSPHTTDLRVEVKPGPNELKPFEIP